MTIDRRFAKDVARELDRRNRRRRMMFLGTALAIVILAVMYLRCGSGWGLGGSGGGGSGKGAGTTSASDAGPRRCSVRVAANGITVDGKLVTRSQALEVCRRTAGADVIVTGDAREGDWAELKKALEAAKVDIFLRNSR
jgi:hypothetical protein